MFNRTASPYFSTRAFQSWCSLGFGGVAISFLSTLQASPTIVGLTATAFVLPSIWSLVESHRERNGDKLPAPTSYQANLRERREFGALPFGGLFCKWKAELSLEDTITEAAYCSNEYGRRLSVICVRIPGLPPVMRDPVVNLLRRHIRSKDEVEIAGDDEFIVCSHLLRDALAADVIFNRLERALRGADMLSASLDIQLGKAIYPMHGYTGSDLISHARSTLQPIATRS